MEKKNNSFFHWLQSFFKKSSNEQPSDKKLSKYHYAIAILAVGISFMLVSNMLTDSSSSAPSGDLAVFNQNEPENQPTLGKESSDSEDVLREVENHFETQLKEILQSAIGVDEVDIMVNLDATESKVFEKNVTTQTQSTDETDREGGTRKVEDTSKDEQLVIIRNGDTETPVTIKIKKPEVRGVLIVANGADNIQVKKNIIEAVTRVLDVPSHRVSVLPKKKPKGES